MSDEEDEFAFDFSKKKKKKKPKAVDAGGDAGAESTSTPADTPSDVAAATASAPGTSATETSASTGNDGGGDGGGGDEGGDDFDDFDFDSSKKKKKKKAVTFGEGSPAAATADSGAAAGSALKNGSSAATASTGAAADSNTSGDASQPSSTVPWAGTDRDYAYSELVDRVFAIMNADRPELSGGKKRYVMKPPQVCRDGTKKTLWINIAEMCRALKRSPDHVVQYVFAELGTTGSIDGSNRLVIKGRFQPKQIENVVRHYISEYVTCRTCRSPETLLKKENRLYFLCCDSCGSTRTVTTVAKGFEAQVGKRRLQRNKLAAIGK